jgi:phosphoglycolate phosphatase-like HAD superfamily hydrolase
MLDLLAEREEVKSRNFKLPKLDSLRAWLGSPGPLDNAALTKMVAKTQDPILSQTLTWSKAVNGAIAALVHNIPPFPLVRESLEKVSRSADLICVSQTPGEALEREWTEHDLDRYLALIAGQEFGSKKEQLKLAAGDKYPVHHVLLVGDAWGDWEAAVESGALFFPINPGQEEDSWRRFFDEALDRFFAEQFDGPYQAGLVREFQALLPELPPWTRSRD